MVMSDVEASLAYLRAKGRSDNGLFLRYSVDSHNRLVNPYWANSCSKYDYSCFGIVVEFDSTYNRNKY